MNRSRKHLKDTEKPTHDPDLAVIWERLPKEFVSWEGAPEIRRLAEQIGIESHRQSEAKRTVKGTTEPLAVHRLGLCFAVHDHILGPQRETALGFRSKKRFVEDCLTGLLFQKVSNTWDMLSVVELAEEHGLERNHVQLNWTSALALKRAGAKLGKYPEVFQRLVAMWKECEGAKMTEKIREVVKSTNSSVFTSAGEKIIRAARSHLELGQKSDFLGIAVEQFARGLLRVAEDHRRSAEHPDVRVLEIEEYPEVEEVAS